MGVLRVNGDSPEREFDREGGFVEIELCGGSPVFTYYSPLREFAVVYEFWLVSWLSPSPNVFVVKYRAGVSVADKGNTHAGKLFPPDACSLESEGGGAPPLKMIDRCRID